MVPESVLQKLKTDENYIIRPANARMAKKTLNETARNYTDAMAKF